MSIAERLKGQAIQIEYSNSQWVKFDVEGKYVAGKITQIQWDRQTQFGVTATITILEETSGEELNIDLENEALKEGLIKNPQYKFNKQLFPLNRKLEVGDNIYIKYTGKEMRKNSKGIPYSLKHYEISIEPIEIQSQAQVAQPQQQPQPQQQVQPQPQQQQANQQHIPY